MSLLYVIGACALVMVLLILCRLTQLDKFPRSKINDFMSKLKAGPIIHRGGQPENTRAAFRRAKSQGATGVEVDMAISKDGCPVLIHDSTVDRTSNGSGSVNQLTLEELKTLDFGVNAGCVWCCHTTNGPPPPRAVCASNIVIPHLYYIYILG